jgi:hypothetical protein
VKNADVRSLDDLCGYITEHVAHIYVRLGPRTVCLADLPPADAIREALRFIREGRVPVIVCEAPSIS